MMEKQRMINLLNYCFDNKIEPWNNQENQKTVESFIISIGGLDNSSKDIKETEAYKKGYIDGTIEAHRCAERD